MQKAADLDTKEKILEAAATLFAQKGFTGTSVRDIAQTAGVNLAAINYHFSNKKNLLTQVVKFEVDCLKAGITALEEHEQHTFVEIIPLVFDMMMEHGMNTLNLMRIILSDESKDIEDFDTEDDFVGPPGGKILYEILSKDVGEEVPEEERIWVIRSIFGLLIHKVTMLHSHICQTEKMKCNFNQEIAKEGIVKLAHTLVESIKKN
jgi:AcrR family transcriptional regulator